MPARDISQINQINQGIVPPAPPAPTTPPPALINEPVPPPPPQSLDTPSPPVPSEEVVSQDAISSPSGPKDNKKLFKTLGIIVGVLVLLGVGFFVYRMFGSKKVEQEEVSLTWWGLWEDESVVEPLIVEYQTTNPGVVVNYVVQSKQDYRERLLSALAKGEGPDIFRFHNTWVPMLQKSLDSVPADVLSASEFATTYYPVANSDLISGTSFVGIPLEYDAITLFVNEDIFASAGKTPPSSWNDLRNLALELTIKDETGTIEQSGVALGRTENVDHWQEVLALMMIQNGVNLSNPIGELASDALTFFTVFSEVDGVWDETLPPSTTAFASGKLAMYFGPSWRALEIAQVNPALKFKTVALPQLPKNNPSDSDIAYASYWVEGVWSRSNHKEEAWKFLSFMSQRSSLEKFYASASTVRPFGEPYPRSDMATLLSTHPILGSIVNSAPGAKSWYLASRTWDGPTGINSQISQYYEDAVNSVNTGGDVVEVLQTLVAGVKQVLGQYGVSR